MNNRVVNVYSDAFFELSKEKNKLKTHKKDLQAIKEIITEHMELKGAILSPTIEKSDKKNLIKKIFSDIDNDTLNLINVLIDKSRFTVFEDLTRDFNKKYNKEFNISEGKIYSANKLDEKEIKDLEKVLSKKFNKKVELENEIDNKLIGGVSILLDGKRIDNSVKFRLESLKAHLMKEGE